MPETNHDLDTDLELFGSAVVNLGDADSMLAQKHGGTEESHLHERKTSEKEPLDEDLTADDYARQDTVAKGQRAERLHENERDKQPMYWNLLYSATCRPLSTHELETLRESGLPLPKELFEVQNRLQAVKDILDTRKNEVLMELQDKKADIDEMTPEERLNIATAIESTRLLTTYMSMEDGKTKVANLLAPLGISLNEYMTFYKRSDVELVDVPIRPDFVPRPGGLKYEKEQLENLTEDEIDDIIEKHFDALVKHQAYVLGNVNDVLTKEAYAPYKVLRSGYQRILEDHGVEVSAQLRRTMASEWKNPSATVEEDLIERKQDIADARAGVTIDTSYVSRVPKDMEFKGPRTEDMRLELAYEAQLALAHAQTEDGIRRLYDKNWYRRCVESVTPETQSVYATPYYTANKAYRNDDVLPGGYVERSGFKDTYGNGLGRSAEAAATGGERFKPSTTSKSPMRMNPVRG